MALNFGPIAPYPVVSLGANSQSLLEELERKLDVLIKGCFQKGAFVKLSSRSPKDVTLFRTDFNSFLDHEIANAIESTPDMQEEVLNALIFFRAATNANKVTSGKEAMFLLLNSQRVYDDLNVYLRMVNELEEEPNEHSSMSVIVREWIDIDSTLECRAFVSGGELAAMTQYSAQYFSPILATKNNEVEMAYLNYWKTVKDAISLTDYTIDFALSRDSPARVWVIEINPPPPVSGTTLFKWNDEEDRRALKSGPYEFRSLQTPSPYQATDNVPPAVLQYIKDKRLALASQNTGPCLVQ
jgi:hypothetical protein